MSVNIEADCQFFTHLNIKLVDSIFAKNCKHTLLGILTRYLNDEILRFPVVTSSV